MEARRRLQQLVERMACANGRSEAESKRRPANRAEFIEGVRELDEFIDEVGGGRIERRSRRGSRVCVAMRALDGELYYLRIDADNYLEEPPACTFVNGAGRQNPEAWPAFDRRGPFRPPHFICTPPTREFFAYHSERSYRHGEGTLVNTVATIYAALNAPEYGGRWTPNSVRVRRRPRQRDPEPELPF